MRSLFCAALVGLGLGLGWAGPGAAAVTYRLQLDYAFLGLPDAYMTYVSPDFITASRIVPGVDLASCFEPAYPLDNHCDGARFIVGDPTQLEVMVFGAFVLPPGPQMPYFFAPGSFAHTGVYDALSGGFSLTEGRLTVSQGVPEPAAWTLLIAGFAAVGTMARRAQAGRKPA